MSHWIFNLTIVFTLFTVLTPLTVKNVLVGGLTQDSFVIKGRTDAFSLYCEITDSTTRSQYNPNVAIDSGFFTINAKVDTKREFTVKICSNSSSCSNPLYIRKVATPDLYNISFIVTSNIDSNTKSYVLERLQNEEIAISPSITEKIFPLKKKIDFIMILGNIHDSPKDTDSEEEYIKQYDKYLFKNEKMKALLESHPIIYFFNDLDFAGTKSNSKSKGVDAINSAYRKLFPSYELPEKGIYQSFTMGFSKFIMTDSRTFMDVENGKLFGDAQREWIKKQLTDAFALIGTVAPIMQIYITVTQPWNYVEDEYSSDIVKQGYESLSKELAEEKGIIYQLLKDNTINFYFPKKAKFISVILIIGERHLAFDNGNWNNYGSVPMVVCGPLDSWQQCRGGPYSHGSFHDTKNQYCLFNSFMMPTQSIPMTSLAGVLSDKDKKIGDQFVFAYNTILNENFPGRVNLKCPIDWKEKLIHAAILLVIGLIAGFIFFFHLYWISIKKLAFQHVKFKTN